MPVRNGAGGVEAALESIRSQTLRDWECLVVDDGSDDATPGYLRQIARNEPRIRVVRQPPSGIVAALNRGLAEARAEFIARMDADDVSLPGRLEAQHDYLRQHRSIGVVGCRVRFGGDGSVSGGYALHVDWVNSLTTPDQIRLNRFVESPFAHPSVMLRRDWVERLGGYRQGPFPEDYELWLRGLDAGVEMAKLEAELLVWNDPPSRASRIDPRYDPGAFFAVKAPYLARAIQQTRRDRPVWIWGAGRLTRRRVDLLAAQGVAIAGYIDVDPRKAGRVVQGRPVIGPELIPAPRDALVVSYVTKWGARELIRGQLKSRGYAEGEDFWVAG